MSVEHISTEELKRLEACESEEDWNAACDAIKEARGGRYPRDWRSRVMTSGLMARVVGRWR